MARCRNILIVEDDLDILDLMKQALEIEGYTVDTATNGKEGLEILDRIQVPCLILLDMMMPVMDGWAFLQTKKHADVLASIPVVIVTAAGDNAKSADAQGFMKKPIDLNALYATVKKYCPREVD